MNVMLDVTGGETAIARYDVAKRLLEQAKLQELLGGIEQLALRNATLQEKLAFLTRYNGKWKYPF